VVPHVDVVDVGVVVEATGDEVVGVGLLIVPSLCDGGVPLCDVDGYLVTFLVVRTLCLLFNHFFLAYARVG
jgi:hypothetical protein